MNEPVRHLTLEEQKTFHEAWRKSTKPSGFRLAVYDHKCIRISKAEAERYAREAGSEYRQLLERVATPSPSGSRV